QVMRLEVHEAEDARHGRGKLAEGVEEVLRLERHALAEVLVVRLGAPADARRVPEGTGGLRVERAAGAELALTERVHRVAHGGEVRGTEALEDPGQAGGVRRHPARIGVEAEAESG